MRATFAVRKEAMETIDKDESERTAR